MVLMIKVKVLFNDNNTYSSDASSIVVLICDTSGAGAPDKVVSVSSVTLSTTVDSSGGKATAELKLSCKRNIKIKHVLSVSTTTSSSFILFLITHHYK